jgi:hypothetical protein
MKRGRIEALGNAGAYGPETADTLVTNRPFSFAFLSSRQNVVNVIVREGRGHPGYLVHNIDTDQYFQSQRAAAKFLGTDEMVISRHLRGKLPHAKGYRFKRVAFS